jgi:hypothetical protein
MESLVHYRKGLSIFFFYLFISANCDNALDKAVCSSALPSMAALLEKCIVVMLNSVKKNQGTLLKNHNSE